MYGGGSGDDLGDAVAQHRALHDVMIALGMPEATRNLHLIDLSRDTQTGNLQSEPTTSFPYHLPKGIELRVIW